MGVRRDMWELVMTTPWPKDMSNQVTIVGHLLARMITPVAVHLRFVGQQQREVGIVLTSSVRQ